MKVNVAYCAAPPRKPPGVRGSPVATFKGRAHSFRVKPIGLLWRQERSLSEPSGLKEELRPGTPQERLDLLKSLCADAVRMLQAMPEERRRRALEYRQPLPESSQRALQRLRNAATGRRGQPEDEPWAPKD